MQAFEFVIFHAGSDNSMDSWRKRKYDLGEIANNLGLIELSEDKLVEDSDTEKDISYELNNTERDEAENHTEDKYFKSTVIL